MSFRVLYSPGGHLAAGRFFACARVGTTQLAVVAHRLADRPGPRVVSSQDGAGRASRLSGRMGALPKQTLFTFVSGLAGVLPNML